jgi:hypothetical protein
MRPAPQPQPFDELLRTSYGKTVFDRLKKSKDAQAAILALSGKKGDGRDAIIRACIVAEYLRLTFPAHLAAAQAMRREYAKVFDELKHLRLFVDEIIEGPDTKDLIFYYVNPTPAQIDAVEKGLAVLNSWNEARDDIAQKVGPVLLGATRKTKTPQAAETAAIGSLASRIKKMCGRPNYAHVATLASIALNTAEAVSIDRIRKALRAHKRGPFGA